jgi:glycyl-tRNA synthetase beta chain
MADLIFEIGTEELPASFIVPATQTLQTAWRAAADRLRLTDSKDEVHGTPRRLVLLVRNLPEMTQAESVTQTGPAVNAPPQAKEGFAKKIGVPVEDLIHREGRWVGVQTKPGQSLRSLLPELLGGLIPELAKNRKVMRWGNEEVTFPRPVRWLLAVFGGEVVPVKFGDVTAGGVTYGHRFLAPQEISVRACDEYLPKMLAAKVVASIPERRKRVTEEIDRVAREAGGRRVPDDELLDTITGLVEWPTGVLGSFERDALDMPREVLVSEMRGHQKYASIESADGKLLPSFCAVANTPVRDIAVSRRGYERVLRARLADARYFFDEDRTRNLGDRVADLRRVTFQERLGSVHDKVERIAHLAKKFGADAGVKDGQAVERVAYLSKADLTTGMVGEFPELQGIMGREYARAAGEPEPVAVGVFEHYLPRGAHDTLPTGDLGAIVGIADRLDTIGGIFAIGKAPTGANDPFALRRACLGVIRIVLARGYRLKLSVLIPAALEHHYARFNAAPPPPPGKDGKPQKKDVTLDRADAQAQILEFFRGRLKALWSEDHPADVVEAVLVAGFDDLVDAGARLAALSEIAGRPDFIPIATAFGRASSIIEKQARDLKPGLVDPALLKEEPERALLAGSQAAATQVAAALRTADYRTALRALADLRPAVDLFFDKVLVMVEGDPPLRQNRLRLVQGVQQLFAPIADFARIQTR